jgi:hypothetical protein
VLVFRVWSKGKLTSSAMTSSFSKFFQVYWPNPWGVPN